MSQIKKPKKMKEPTRNEIIEIVLNGDFDVGNYERGYNEAIRKYEKWLPSEDEILEKLYWHAHETGVQKNMPDNEISISKARTAIIELIISRLPPKPKFWKVMGGALRTYNEGKRDYRKEVLKRLEGKE